MKQPGLDKLREAFDSDDALKLVNAFHVIPDINVEILSDYWLHRVCALAELFQEWKKKKLKRTKKK